MNFDNEVLRGRQIALEQQIISRLVDNRVVTLAALRGAKRYLCRNHADIQKSCSLSYEDFKKERYICHALDSFRETHRYPLKYSTVIGNIQRLIQLRLAGSYSLEAWLQCNNAPGFGSNWEDDFNNKIQLTRHAWVDSLIKEFSV